MAKQDDTERFPTEFTTDIMDEFKKNYPNELYNGGIEEYEDALDYVNFPVKGERLG